MKNSYELADHFTWRKDKHTLKMGAEFQRASAFNFQNPAPVRGSFNFDGRYTGHSFADFLLGANRRHQPREQERRGGAS